MIDRPLRMLKDVMNEFDCMEDYTYLQTTSAAFWDKIEQLNTSTFSTGYCHYDYFPKNFFFDEDNNISIFDFDFAGKGFLANDLSSFMMHLFYHTFSKAITEEEAFHSFDVLIEQYRTIRTLSDNEVKAVPYLGYILLLFYLGFQHENFEDWSNLFFGPKFVKARVAEMKKYAEMFCKES
jgi:Ser/Thr protein kinase RdoA (MazF antagonist)